MATVHIISHTHWDREWYQTFQQFRLRLVHTLDKLLAILAEDPDYRYFMLDGQTVVLEDYLDMRPEKEAELRAHIATGRILIGPWRCLPDEFLVSPESIIRNLLEGKKDCARFGVRMNIGYIPDTFGHIGQMPQILSRFGLQTACVWRGLADEPCELWWEAADGSRVLLAYLRESYSNAQWLPASTLEKSTAEIQRLTESLLPYATSGQVLLMHGTDHQEPHRDTPKMLAYAASKMEGRAILHSTLTAYIEAMQAGIERLKLSLPIVRGELRACKRQHLLPGVLSSRMWIKQRNHTCETLLEQWAEPFTAWAYLMGKEESDVLDRLRDARLIENPAPLVRNAWRLLMECHPHDSICGCSIDQVHAEMQSRFDQVEQIGAEIAAQALSALSLHIDTHAAEGQREKEARASAIVVYNPIHGPRTDLVFVQVLLPLGAQDIMILDDVGNPMPHRVLETPLPTEVFKAELDRNGLLAMLQMAQEARIPGMRIFDAGFRREGENFYLEIALCDSALDAEGELQTHAAEIEGRMADTAIRRFHLRVNMHMPATLQFIARGVPGFGYKTYRMQAVQEIKKEPKQVTTRIENEFFTLEASPADGTLTVTDKRNGAIFRGLNRFVDGGDCGDEYNYCPPAADRLIDTPHIQSIRVEKDNLMQATEVSLILSVPATLSADRQSRSEESTSLTIVTRATLAPGVERVDIATQVENLSRDHRLRVHFPVPFSTNNACYDGHFEVVERSIGLPEYDATWVEDPRPEVPQRAFTDVSDGASGLMIANRGLPEVEVCRAAQGMEIALTLLRCVGWLSRDDFPARKGHAGPPGLETPAAQMPGTHTLAYSIIPHQGSWRSAYLHAYAFNAPLKAVATTIHKGRLPHTGSFLRVEPPEFVLSAIKTAEDNHGLIFRGYNISGESIEVSLRPLKTFARISRVMLDETGETELPLDLDGTVRFQARGHEIVTLRFR